MSDEPKIAGFRFLDIEGVPRIAIEVPPPERIAKKDFDAVWAKGFAGALCYLEDVNAAVPDGQLQYAIALLKLGLNSLAPTPVWKVAP